MSNKRNDSGERLPILDELNDLIEKERTLLSLKLLAQKSETETWKSKYDMLLGKVGSSHIELADDVPQLLEAAASIENEERIDISETDIQRLLVNRTSSWALDLRGVKIDKTNFAKLIKEVFGSRSLFEKVNSVYMARCGLTDEFMLPLISMVRSPRLQALDVSHNEMGEMLFLQLLTALQDRRCTPQYLLLEDNPPMSAATKHFEALLEVLSEHTWGLTASLPDFADPAQPAPPPKQSKKAAAAARKEPNYDYKDVTKPPMVAYEFLRAFNSKLDPASAPAVIGSKSSKAAAKKSATASAKGAVLGRLSGLHGMTAFGLTHCHLSKRTVELLATTLTHLAPTLTDLDLSFAFVGFPGAQMLRSVLGDAACQLVRLGLAGNALGDSGLAALSAGVKVNKTLTYLDLRGNALSGSALAALAPAVRGNAVLSVLDLRGNSFGLDATLTFSRQLTNWGLQLFVRFDSSCGASSRPSPEERCSIYRDMNLVKLVGSVGKATKLHSVDLGKVFVDHPDKIGQPVTLQWNWRPVPLGTHSTAGQLLASPSPSSSGESKQTAATAKTPPSRADRGSHAKGKGASVAETDNASYFQMGSRYCASWEVRVVVNSTQEVFLHRVCTEPGSALTRRVLLDRSASPSSSEWIACSLLLLPADLPSKATVDIFAICEDPAEGRDQYARPFVAFEAMDFRLSTAPAPLPFGGDGIGFSDDTTAALGKSGFNPQKLFASFPSLKSMKVLRWFSWAHQAHGVRLTFESKLTSVADEGTTTSPAHGGRRENEVDGAAASLLPNYHSLGYAWAIYVLGAEGGLRTAAEGLCGGGEDPALGSNAGSLLQAWLWRRQAASLSGLHCGDVIVLAAKAISEQPGYPALLLAKCLVSAKACVLQTEDGAGDGSVCCGVDESCAFAKHDVPTILPM